jgi:TonB family protein
MAAGSATAEAPVYPIDRRKFAQAWLQPERRRTPSAIRLDEWDDPVSARRQATFLALSFILHGLLFSAGWRFPSHRLYNSAIEVDLTGPYEIVPPGTAAFSRPVRRGDPQGPSEGRKTKVAEFPRPAQTPVSARTANQKPADEPPARRGSLTGVDEGGTEVALVTLTAIPHLLNARDLQAFLRTYYPESERLAGHEGRVVVDLHIDAAGIVTRSEIVVSAGEEFDQAALRIASLLRFSPARVGERPFPAKLRQAISFRLEN